MGFKENIITNWEDKTIEYQGRYFYILKQFDNNGKTYLYGINKDTISSENLEVVFLYKVKDDIFAHVESQEEFERLMIAVSGLCTADLIMEAGKKYKDQLKPNN